MLMNKMWRIFENTGNINAYLYYKDITYSLKKKEKSLSNITNEEKRA